MAFDPSPTGYFSNGYQTTGGNITIVSGALEAVRVNPAATGDIQDVVYSILESVANRYAAITVADDLPPNMTITRSSSVPTNDTIRKSYTVTLTLSLPDTQVV